MIYKYTNDLGDEYEFHFQTWDEIDVMFQALRDLQHLRQQAIARDDLQDKVRARIITDGIVRALKLE